MFTQPLKQQRPLLGQSRSRTPGASVTNNCYGDSSKKLDRFTNAKTDFSLQNCKAFLDS
jgi:hypothetical protein